LKTSKHNDLESEQLAAAGLDSSLRPSEALAKIQALRGTSGISDLAIARVLGGIADSAAVAMLLEMETGASGPLRREIRRSLFRLGQHGFRAPERVAGDAPAEKATTTTASALTAMLSPIDNEGARIVWIIKPRMQGGVLRLWALVSDAEGLVGAQNTGLSRRELKSEREELQRRAQMKLVEADWRLADFILCEAYRNTPAARRGIVGNFLAIRAELIGTPPPAEIDHPIYTELAAESAAEPSLELLKEPEMLEWRLPDASIKPYVEEIGKVGESLIVVSPMHQQERINAIIERAASELLAADSGMRMRRRLEDMAYYMMREGRRTQAGWAAGAAAKLRDGADLSHDPLFQAFIRTQLGTVAAAEQQKASEEPRLIMTPAEAMRAREAARMRRR
jgi:hypothetical protein